MANEGDLWDDSVLVTAFNEAISNYKMHGMKASDIITEDQNVIDVNVENPEAIRQGKENEKSKPQTNSASEVEGSSKENKHLESVDPNVSDSHVEVCGDTQNSYSHSQASQEYNQLLNQYHELELKRQQVMNQLYQYSTWNYQYSNEAYGYGTSNGSNPTTFSSCCPCVGQCVAAPCTSVPSYCLAVPSADSFAPPDLRKSSLRQEDSNIVETAMGAAERAMSSLRIRITNDSNLNEANKGKENDSSETDLTEVLNAWYSAGFYTGKYLVEQSVSKRHNN